VQKPTAMRHYK